MIESKNFIFKTTLFYTGLFFIFIATFGYFYIHLEIKSYQNEQKNLLIQYSQKIQRAIYDFSVSQSENFIVPQSFQYDLQLKDKQGKIIYRSNKIERDQSKLEVEIELASNRLEIKYLSVSMEISYKKIYLKFLILGIYMIFFIFIAIFLIIKSSIEPYKKANKFLDAFFDDAMHELKTPLGIIQLNLEILQEKQPNLKEIIRSLNGVKNLLLVYQDIEYLIKYKNVKFTKEMIDFSQFLNQRVEEFESLAFSKNLTFYTEIEKNITVFINRTQLQRIIDNTLSNSIKYSTPNNKINLKLFLNEKSEICYSIQNFGEIIPDTKKIFNRYYKGDAIKGGFGIGLDIVKKICTINHISIEVVSNTKEGNIFSFVFLKNT